MLKITNPSHDTLLIKTRLLADRVEQPVSLKSGVSLSHFDAEKAYRVPKSGVDISFRSENGINTGGPNLYLCQPIPTPSVRQTSSPGCSARMCLRPSSEARTQSSLILLTAKISQHLDITKTHTWNAPVDDHGQGGTGSTSSGNKRVQEEDLIHRRRGRKFGIVYSLSRL